MKRFAALAVLSIVALMAAAAPSAATPVLWVGVPTCDEPCSSVSVHINGLGFTPGEQIQFAVSVRAHLAFNCRDFSTSSQILGTVSAQLPYLVQVKGNGTLPQTAVISFPTYSGPAPTCPAGSHLVRVYEYFSPVTVTDLTDGLTFTSYSLYHARLW